MFTDSISLTSFSRCLSMHLGCVKGIVPLVASAPPPLQVPHPEPCHPGSCPPAIWALPVGRGVWRCPTCLHRFFHPNCGAGFVSAAGMCLCRSSITMFEDLPAAAVTAAAACTGLAGLMQRLLAISVSVSVLHVSDWVVRTLLCTCLHAVLTSFVPQEHVQKALPSSYDGHMCAAGPA